VNVGDPLSDPADAELDRWASRLLDAEATVIEASGAKVVALLQGASEPVVVGVEWDLCPCRQFQRFASCGCPGRPRCRHTRALTRMRRALARREERAGLEEIRRLGAAGTGATSRAEATRGRPLLRASARPVTARADGD
jgi:hypothetical protein